MKSFLFVNIIISFILISLLKNVSLDNSTFVDEGKWAFPRKTIVMFLGMSLKKDVQKYILLTLLKRNAFILWIAWFRSVTFISFKKKKETSFSVFFLLLCWEFAIEGRYTNVLCCLTCHSKDNCYLMTNISFFLFLLLNDDNVWKFKEKNEKDGRYSIQQ